MSISACIGRRLRSAHGPALRLDQLQRSAIIVIHSALACMLHTGCLGERSLGTREESRDSRLALFVLSNLRFAHALAHATLFNILLNWRASNSKRFSCESLQVVVQFMSDMHTPNIHQSFAMRGREQERCTIAVALPRPQRSEESSMKLNVICNHVRGSMKLES